MESSTIIIKGVALIIRLLCHVANLNPDGYLQKDVDAYFRILKKEGF